MRFLFLPSLKAQAHMRRSTISLLIVFASSSLLVACSSQKNSTNKETPVMAVAAEPETPSDPIAELKPFIEERESKIKDGASWNPGDSFGAIDISAASTNTSFDVTQTDSLVSPYLATINYDISYTITVKSKTEPDSAKCRESYAYQDNQWILKSQEFIGLLELDSSTWESYPAEKSVAAVACGFVDSYQRP
jgi:hypothetical protein